MMPDMDGWQVCKAVRAFSNLPILILSALDEPAIVASVLDIGADDFLVKPVPSTVLVAHLNKLARRTDAVRRFPHDRSRWQPTTSPLAP
jgi:DNA-binding response OmpR family regulator